MFDLQSKIDITGGCELKDGHHKSVRIAENVAELQIDAKISPFHQGLPFLLYLGNRFDLGPHDDFCSHQVIGKLAPLNGLFVRTIDKSNNEILMVHTLISVATCFETIYKKKLECPHFPCVIRKVGKDNVTNKEIEMHYPIKVLEVQQGQKFPKDDIFMTNNQEQNMIKASQRLPNIMIKEIENQKTLASIFDVDQYVSAAQVQISPGMKTIKDEILNAPVITYKNDVPKQVDYSVWDLRDVGFVKPVEINASAIFYNNVSHNTVLLGMRIHSKECFGLTNGQLNASYLEETILHYRNKDGVDFVLAFVSGSEVHNILKATEIVTKVPTQQVEPKIVTNPKLGAGTAKPPVSSIIFPSSGDADLIPHFLKNITHAFCYLHEIVDSSISVPHTLRSAEQMANRGSKLWHSKNKQLDYSEEDKVYSRATTALIPQIPSRYWAQLVLY
uniref:Uncharacterized protein n=1 Tax=Panagrolaimus sp. PS1159 TaxID=55785 RepID=A0AC35GCP9_9BILA